MAEMTSKERVMKTLKHEEPDRVPEGDPAELQRSDSSG